MSVHWLAEQFGSHLGQALEMMSGDKPSISAETAPNPPSGSYGFLEQPFSLQGASAWFAGPESAWVAIGAGLLRAAGIEEHDAETAKSTFVEVLNQASAGLAREIGRTVGREVTTSGGETRADGPTSHDWFTLLIQSGTAEHNDFMVSFSPALTSLLGDCLPVSRDDGKSDRALMQTARPRIENSKTLDLLLDVELPVSVSFGRAQLPLKDVIKLTTGSIVELNRTIGEPVEVIVNNCVIARGEVVVVEGNFGVRIHQVISKQDRLRTLY